MRALFPMGDIELLFFVCTKINVFNRSRIGVNNMQWILHDVPIGKI